MKGFVGIFFNFCAVTFWLLAMVLAYSGTARAQANINQRSTGDCSPNIVSGANVNVVCPPKPQGMPMPCDPASEGALSEWNGKILANQGNWKALVYFGQAKLSLLDTYCDMNSRITKSRLADTLSLLGMSYLFTGNGQMACRSLGRAASYYSNLGKSDDANDVKRAMRKAGCQL